MRHCKYCGVDKPWNSLAKRDSAASLFWGAKCWDCYRQYADKLNKAKRSTPEGRAAASQAAVRWKQTHVGHANALVQQYEQSKAKRIPPWANHVAIKAVYKEAAAKGLTVDHIVPLRGKYVSGLHVENNLQLLTKAENSKKSNNY